MTLAHAQNAFLIDERTHSRSWKVATVTFHLDLNCLRWYWLLRATPKYQINGRHAMNTGSEVS